ncbi:hypothetical protein NJB1907f44_21430 [Mycobacterium marinum]|nr:hypothetical protein NJB1907f34b_07910 [Mycobacterium marinum]GJO06785.1 hypothetical protein NJB1907E90_18690 [Mycobacterium marinum]GJO07917.1 hypothetical protein NJB1808e29_39510 [Mycobacterium marinum]GJO21742.1 hypothetical protein NJB1907E11_31110 [Mycobacterium marinum]GJO23085.1 hypothetical protein NJB1728e18_26790 [Mycobacterium marinum]
MPPRPINRTNSYGPKRDPTREPGPVSLTVNAPFAWAPIPPGPTLHIHATDARDAGAPKPVVNTR